MSKLSELAEEKCELEMTPMIDVTFLLLIFFLCTLKFKTLEGKLAAYLPKDVGVNQTEAEPIEKVEILVRVLKDGTKMKPVPGGLVRYQPQDKGRFEWDTDRRLQYSVANFKTEDLVTLRNKLVKVHRDRAASEDKVPATIDARPGTNYRDVVDVLDQALEAGFKDITFVGAYAEHIK